MLINKTKDKVLVSNHKLCKSILSQSLGLMFSRKKEDFGLVFEFASERRVSLHMFFVFYKIDVLFLDSDRKVVDLKQGFKPFTFYSSMKRVKYVLELPAGIIRSTDTSINDFIGF